MIFQEPLTSLNPVFTVGNQIGESLALHRGMRGSPARAETVRLLAEVGFPEPEAGAGSFPHELSGGMRQRAMMAMALAGEPELLIADEPTTALDATTAAQVLALLEEIRTSRGMGLLLISHDLSVVSRVCDRVLVFYGGQVVEGGPTREILERPRHPYTAGLLESRLAWRTGPRKLTPIPGEVPEASAWPGGCRFHTRCPEVLDRCRREAPPLEAEAEESDRSGAGRQLRCWLAEREEEG
jgi:oligopeptide/dipeptide ABC transporter ATP-binding protein